MLCVSPKDFREREKEKEEAQIQMNLLPGPALIPIKYGEVESILKFVLRSLLLCVL
jgi:hypothetical protein